MRTEIPTEEFTTPTCMNTSDRDVVRELRQIKWTLLGILLCLALIVLSELPGLTFFLNVLAGLVLITVFVAIVWLVGRDRWRRFFFRLTRRRR